MKHRLIEVQQRAAALPPTLQAYSEFMPPPFLGLKPSGSEEPGLLPDENPYGWNVTEYEEALELQPGFAHLAESFLTAMEHLGNGRPAHGIARVKLEDNPFWPAELAARAGQLPHERYVIVAPLALSRTQDDKGRIRWTLFGGSEQGPERPFWRSFYTAPGREVDAATGLRYLGELLSVASGRIGATWDDLRAAGLRILPGAGCPLFPGYWASVDIPSWSKPLLLADEHQLGGVRYLLTFRPFASLSAEIRDAYLAGRLRLLPFPGSLLFWGAKPYLALQRELPFALQLPLLALFSRHENPHGLRVPQSGYLHEAHPDHPVPDAGALPLRNTIRRTHRGQRLARDLDEALEGREDPVVQALFSSSPAHMGLYDKPMAHNAQLWSHDFHLVLDGPHADADAIRQASERVTGGGLFGYRFFYPAMRVGRYEVYWQRPLVACRPDPDQKAVVLHSGALGYLTAYDCERPDLAHPVELWPQRLNRPAHRAALDSLAALVTHPLHRVTLQSARKLLDAAAGWESGPLPRTFARALLTHARHETLEAWFRYLETSAMNPAAGHVLAQALRERVAPAAVAPTTPAPQQLPESITYRRNATRAFEQRYWHTIVRLAQGRFRHKDNADCPRDGISERAYHHHHQRDLEALGDSLLADYRRAIARAGMTGQAQVGFLPFAWRTDFDFDWSDGWRKSQDGHQAERDLLLIIPGHDRTRAVIMADHYDTAYMEDKYEQARGGNGTRLSSAGADDNHSATAALLLGAREFLRLSREGRLACDIWLVHLTGEEFPSDCMGARHLTQALLAGSLHIRHDDASETNLSNVRIAGVFVLDMIAHNRDASDPEGRDVFQISPGTGRDALRLAYQAHAANAAWNASVPSWDRRPSRCHRGPGARTADPHGATIPATARHALVHGEVRTTDDPRSSLYNTDGQIFSDAGIPVVLFMENYDINRTGYHDTADNMTNIDLDYGAAVAAIAIETVARVATETTVVGKTMGMPAARTTPVL